MKSKFGVLGLTFTLVASTAWAAPKEITVGVKGMVCGFCAQGIEKKFHSHDAIEGVKVSLGRKQVKLKLKEGQNITDEAIKKFMTESGYNVEKIERN